MQLAETRDGSRFPRNGKPGDAAERAVRFFDAAATDRASRVIGELLQEAGCFPGAGSFETFRERLRIFRGEPRGEHFREDDQPFSGFGNGAEQALYARKVLRLGFPGDVHLNEAGFSHIRKYNFFYFGFAYAQTNSRLLLLVSGTRVRFADAAPGCRRRIGDGSSSASF